MTSKRIQEIQTETAYPNSISVQQALMKVWNEVSQSSSKEPDDEEITKRFWKWCKDIGDPASPSAHAAWDVAFAQGCKWMRGKR